MKPEKSGYYWVFDSEIMDEDKWVLAFFDEPTGRLLVFTPEDSQRFVWDTRYDDATECFDGVATTVVPFEFREINQPEVPGVE